MEQVKLTRRSFVAGATAAGALAALSLTGCGGGSSEKKDDGAKSDDGAKGGTLTGACAYSSTNVNPIGNSSALMLAATWHVFEGLYDLDLHTYKTYNALAADKPTKISDTEYEVALRDGAKFSDGNEVTADDVVNAINQNMADATYGAFLEFIKSVEAKDAKTVSIKLKYAFEALLETRLSVVKVFPKSLSEDELKTNPISSGRGCTRASTATTAAQSNSSPTPTTTARSRRPPTTCIGTYCLTTPRAPRIFRKAPSRSWRTCPTPTPTS